MEKSEIETIYRKYFHDVFLYIRALSENESLAEEITQETFLKAMNNIEKFDGRKDIRAWLFVIAKNTYFRYCRRNKIYVVEEFSEIMQDSMQDTSPVKDANEPIESQTLCRTDTGTLQGSISSADIW